MAQYLLSESPVKFWQSGGLYDCVLGSPPVWIDGRGLFACMHQLGGRTAYVGFIQLDGTFCPISTITRGISFFQNLGFYDDNYVCKEGSFTGSIYYDTRYCYSPSTPDVPGNLGTISSSSMIQRGESATSILRLARDSVYRGYFDLQEIRWSEVNQEYYWATLVNNVVYYDSHPDKFPFNSSRDYTTTISHAGENKFYLCFVSGLFALYDYSINEIVFKDRWIDNFRDDPSVYAAVTVYARSLGVFLTIVVPSSPNTEGNNPCFLRVYANETVPTQLSNPVPLGPVNNLTLTDFEVSLLGAQNDPAEGFKINWSIESGEGELLSPQSETGIDGKATVTYRAPDSGSTDVTIKAEAVY